MKKVVIKRVRTVNFKGFPVLEIDFNAEAVILGGMNGYGKTTVFDALELLITGKIQRMASYSQNLPNHKYSRSQTTLPLVYDMSKEEVKVEAIFSIDGIDVSLCRFAKVGVMKNPVDFTPFNQLYVYNDKEKRYSPVDSSRNEWLGVIQITYDYGFLNYLSQEEATYFLKCKDADRSSAIQSLFDTKSFDEPINKIKSIRKNIDSILNAFDKGLKQLGEDIAQLYNEVINNQHLSQKFVALTVNESKWDQVTPELSHEEMYSFVMDGGVMDGLKYLCKNEKWYHQNNRNIVIQKLTADNSLHPIAFYTWMYPKEKLLEQYSKWQPVIGQIKGITIDSLGEVMYQIEHSVSDVISPGVVDELKILVQNFKTVYLSASSIQKMVTELLSIRASLDETTLRYGKILELSKCPLCGSNYINTSSLFEAIILHKKKIEESFYDLANGLNAQFESINQYIIEHILNPVNRYFETHNVTDELLSDYNKINISQVKNDIHLIKQLGVEIRWQSDIAEIEKSIKEDLLKLVKEVPVGMDVALLQRMYESYYQFLDKDNFTIDNINLKKEYLILHWNMSTSNMLERKMNERASLEKQCGVLKEKKKSITGLEQKIFLKRTQYVNTIISDIQILFYIYTGRILQDSFFGRGLFLKPELSKNRVLFVSGDYYNNDVDALYNMSSGQLVAVSISFFLSLNKLYGSSNIIAIDDPVQTIDDINLWGLMETLRHDFNDSFILLSTHESNYGQLVDYKFRKVGMKSEYIDLTKLHNRTSTITNSGRSK